MTGSRWPTAKTPNTPLFGSSRRAVSRRGSVGIPATASSHASRDKTNGGRLWRIDGPQVHVDAADGAEGVGYVGAGYVGAGGPREFFAYRSFVVDVTTNGGHTWWETFLVVSGGDGSHRMVRGWKRSAPLAQIVGVGGDGLLNPLANFCAARSKRHDAR
jgi:hypothetical protein